MKNPHFNYPPEPKNPTSGDYWIPIYDPNIIATQDNLFHYRFTSAEQAIKWAMMRLESMRLPNQHINSSQWFHNAKALNLQESIEHLQKYGILCFHIWAGTFTTGHVITIMPEKNTTIGRLIYNGKEWMNVSRLEIVP